MSREAGWAAINLEMPGRVPRTEYSAEFHLGLVNAVTGSKLTPGSGDIEKRHGAEAFVKAWDYGMVWSVLTHCRELAACRTDMGHAEYQAGGVDKRETVNCPFSSPDEVVAFDPMSVYGQRDHGELVGEYNTHYARQCERFPDTVNMTGVYITLMSGLIEIFGWEMMLMGMAQPEAFGRMVNRYAAWMLQYFRALADSDAPVVMVHDDIVWTSGPFVDPAWYREYVFPHYKTLFAPLLEADKRILYTSDGNYTMFIDDIAACGVHGFVMEPTTDMAYVAERYGETHAFVGNADTRVLLSGTRADIRAEVERCMAIGKSCPGFIMAVGNHIPPNTPLENALYYNEVYEELARR
jgi:uroporphyrinogen-III decarboxylase